ncbi:hypothetical protein [Cohnella cellulosilytica]|uniref:Uncharacterized protein n=1 Tax=Cohnella cellulosilytica TaxID=986710 RepID=A0ABW2FIQ8_9BACL
MTRNRSNAVSGRPPVLGNRGSNGSIAIGSHRRQGNAPLIGSHRQRREEQPEQPSLGNQDRLQGMQQEPFEMKPMVNGMDKFDEWFPQPHSRMHTVLPSKTFYADTEEKRAPYARKFNEDGTISNQSDGEHLSTIGALSAPVQGSKPDRHIFTMDGGGNFYTADAIHETTKRGREAQARFNLAEPGGQEAPAPVSSYYEGEGGGPEPNYVEIQEESEESGSGYGYSQVAPSTSDNNYIEIQDESAESESDGYGYSQVAPSAPDNNYIEIQDESAESESDGYVPQYMGEQEPRSSDGQYLDSPPDSPDHYYEAQEHDDASTYYGSEVEQEEEETGPQVPYQERFHHSSFLAGQAVAGAGEMQVRDGQIELVSDASGHYRPGSKQMLQTVQELERKKVPVERMGVEFIGKGNAALDADGYASMDESGDTIKETNMQASALELLGYANHRNPENAETEMRANHAKKNRFLSELLGLAGKSKKKDEVRPSDNPQPSRWRRR